MPQLIFQILYSFSIGDITDTVAFAFCASIISVIATLLSFWIDREDEETKVVEYYLMTKCMRSPALSPISSPSTDDGGVTSTIPRARTASSPYSDLSLEVGSNDLSSEQRRAILENRGRTLALSFSLAALWEIQPKRIEVGQTVITKQGDRTHIVQYLYKSDLQIDAENRMDPHFYVQQFYAASSNDLSEIFRAHFSLDDCFNVHFEDKAMANTMRLNSLMSLSPSADSHFDFNDDGHAVLLEQALDRYLKAENEDIGVLRDRVWKMMESENTLSSVDGEGAEDEVAAMDDNEEDAALEAMLQMVTVEHRD